MGVPLLICGILRSITHLGPMTVDSDLFVPEDC